jgi:hypothetical protein
MEDWVAEITGSRRVWEWPKAKTYELEHDPEHGLLIRAIGPPSERVDLSRPRVAEDLASWDTPRLPADRTSLLKLVNRYGLTGPWIPTNKFMRFSPDGPRKWRGATLYGAPQFPGKPPSGQPLDEFRRDVKLVRDVLTAYEVGFAQVWAGDRRPTDPEAETGRDRFELVVPQIMRRLLAEVVQWGVADVVLGRPGRERLDVEAAWVSGIERMPSLTELAVAHVVGLFQDRLPVNRCRNPECGRPFSAQEPRGGRTRKAWTRPDVIYCSQRCAKRAWYLRQPRSKGREK